MAEALTNARADGGFVGYSAGIEPNPGVSTVVTGVLRAHGIPTNDLRSKSWIEFTGPDAPKFEFVVIVSERDEGDFCPDWPGGIRPYRANWFLSDPSRGSQETAQLQARAEANFQIIKRCVNMFLSLPGDTLDRLTTREPHGLDIDETAISLMSQVFRPTAPV